MGKFTWSNPAYIVLFLQNAIQKYTVPIGETGKPQEDIKIKITSWPEFNQQIFKIYDHRISHAPEVNGALNTTYMTLDEHLLLFFLELYKTRPKVENAMIEFLATLKYYSETWERAKLYSQLAGFRQVNDTFLHVPDRTGTGMRVNNGETDECDVPMIDMYL